MKNIYLVFSYTGTIPSRIIKFFTGAPYSHISIAMDEGLEEMYSFARQKVNNPFSGGFVKEDVNSGIFEKFKEYTLCDIYALPVTEQQYNDIKEILKEFQRNSGNLRYNYLGTIFLKFNIPIKRENLYFCSQFVAEILDKSGVYKFSKSVTLVQPDNFYEITNKKHIYTGFLKNYGSDYNRAV